MAGTAYYDRIARKWHAVTGAQGGAFKKLVLNDLVLDKLSSVAGLAILELGAGNGYFMPLVLRRFSGQMPSRIVISDQSAVLLDLAQRSFRLANAEYLLLDVRSTFPFPDASFDLIFANMLFNELTVAGLHQAFAECFRVLVADGRLLATVTHPRFVQSLARRGLLKNSPRGIVTVPGAEGLRLPVVLRRNEEYRTAFERAGFRCYSVDVYATPKVLNEKPGLRMAGHVPLAMLIECARSS